MIIIRHSERIKKHSSLISDTQGSSTGTQSECEHIREHSEIASVTLRYHQWAHSELIRLHSGLNSDTHGSSVGTSHVSSVGTQVSSVVIIIRHSEHIKKHSSLTQVSSVALRDHQQALRVSVSTSGSRHVVIITSGTQSA